MQTVYPADQNFIGPLPLGQTWQQTIPEFCKALDVKVKDCFRIAARPDGLMTDEKWEVDHWSLTLEIEGRTVDLYYSTGIGHRQFPKKKTWDMIRAQEEVKRAPNSRWARTELEKCKVPVCPSIESVMGCLHSDLSMDDYTFEDWCSNFGYNTDSRKALETYLKCQEINAKTKRFLGKHLRRFLECEAY